MVKERMDLLELLHKGGMDGDVDFLREALRVLVEVAVAEDTCPGCGGRLEHEGVRVVYATDIPPIPRSQVTGVPGADMSVPVLR